MTTRALLLGTVLAFTCATASWSADLPKREVGQIVYDGVPETPPALQAAIAPYYNARSAIFEDWLADGSILIATRFGDTNQIHRLAAPGGARTQLTFFNEPINTAIAQPKAQRYLYARDVGGAEYYQAYLRSLNGAEVQVTAPRTRNDNFVFSGDGKTLIWSQVTPGDPNYDIVLADVANPSGRRTIHEGKGAIAPVDISPDGKLALVARYNSATFVEPYVLDLSNGALKAIGPADRKVGYQGGAFTGDGKAVVVLSDDGAEMARPVVFDLATGAMRDLDPGAKWPTESFKLSPDGKTIAYMVNEEGYSRLVLKDLATGKALTAPKLPLGVMTGMGFSPDGRRLGFSLSTSTSAGDVWSWGPGGRQADPLDGERARRP